MKKLILVLLSSFIFNIGISSLNSVQANDKMMKLVMMSQNLSPHQAELAVDAIKSVKLFAEDVKNNKENAQQYMTLLVSEDEMDVAHMMAAYRNWQTNSTIKLEKTLNAVAALHEQLSEEQRKELFETIKRLSQ